ncbi:MAG: DUF2807 domain-containing protein, partial [Pseudolysinimonas sp.]
MTKSLLAPVLIAPALVLALAGCAPVWGVPIASGPRVTDDRTIEAVEAVEIRTSGNLTVTVGDTASLTITAPAASIGRLTSDIVDGVLVLGVSGPQWGWGLGDIDYELTVPRLSGLAVEGSSDVHADFSGADDITISIDGSGDVTGTGVDADSVTSSISGSGDIELAGRTDTLSFEIDGSGGFGGEDLVSRAATVDISGSGDIDVNATETLD